MAFTTLMLPDLIELMRKEGFRFAQLPKVEQDPAYAQNPDAALHYGTSFPGLFMDSRHLTYPPFNPHPNEKLQNLCR
jgi:hypothetical protein